MDELDAAFRAAIFASLDQAIESDAWHIRNLHVTPGSAEPFHRLHLGRACQWGTFWKSSFCSNIVGIHILKLLMIQH